MKIDQEAHNLFIHARQSSPNPFSLESVISSDEVWGDVIADLQTLNQHVDQTVLSAISEVRQKLSKKVGVAIKGDRGTGKSHVIHRIWKTIEHEGHAFFSYIPPCKNPSRIDSHVRVSLCQDFNRPDSEGLTQWQKLAAAIIYTLKESDYEQEYQEYLARCHDPEQLRKYILASIPKAEIPLFLDNLTEAVLESQTNLDFDFVKAVLFTLFKTTKAAQIGLAWLKGDDHPSIKGAGLPLYSPEQQDQKAIWIIQQVAKLAEVVYKPVVICFDELDSAGSDHHSGDSKAEVVARCIDRIYFQCSNVVLICCAISDTWREIEQMMGGIPDRVGQRSANTKPPTVEQMCELVKLRLLWFYQHNKLDASLYPSLFPLQEDKLKNLAREAVGTRTLFKECAKLFAEYQIPDSPDPIVPPPPDRSKQQEFFELYQDLLSKVRISKNQKNDDALAEVIACGLQMVPPRAIENVKVSDVEFIDSNSPHDVHFVICGYDSSLQQNVRIGVRVSDTTTPATLKAVMTRLLDYKRYDLTRGCLVRLTPIPRNLKRGKELEAELVNSKSGEVVVIDDMNAVRSLIALERIYQQAEDYGFTQEELIQFAQNLELVADNPIISEILSAPEATEAA